MRRREPRDLALLLLSKAKEDEAAVRELLDNAAVTNSIVGFHAEQTAEKSLKAVLSSRRVAYPRTHNIAALLDLLYEAKIELPQWAEDLRLLTPFRVATRYELFDSPVENLDRADMYDLIRRVIAWAEREINVTNQENN
jgi:HEPN domain-containing protein